MSTNFPTNLDSLTNPTATDEVNTVDHAGQHADANDAIEALESKVGIDGSADADSHDYKLSEVTDKAVGKAGAQTITGEKTFQSGKLKTTRPKVSNSIDDANGNEVIETPATASAVNHTKITNAAAGNPVEVAAVGDDTNIDIKVKGKGTGKFKYGAQEIVLPDEALTKGDLFVATDATTVAKVSIGAEGTTPISRAAQPTGIAWEEAATSSPDNFISTYDLGAATTNAPSVTLGTSNIRRALGNINTAIIEIDKVNGLGYQTRNMSSDLASADGCKGIYITDTHIYALAAVSGTSTYKLFRWDVDDLETAGTEITFSGQTLGTSTTVMGFTADSTYFYFSNKGNNSATEEILSRYTISGTTLTYVDDLTLDAAIVNPYVALVATESYIYAANDATSSNYRYTQFNKSTGVTVDAETNSHQRGASLFYTGEAVYTHLVLEGGYQKLANFPT